MAARASIPTRRRWLHEQVDLAPPKLRGLPRRVPESYATRMITCNYAHKPGHDVGVWRGEEGSCPALRVRQTTILRPKNAVAAARRDYAGADAYTGPVVHEEIQVWHSFCDIDIMETRYGALVSHAPKGALIMNASRETYWHSPHELEIPQPYRSTPDGFKRRQQAWVRLAADDGPTPEAGEAGAPQKSMAFQIIPEEVHDMPTARHPIRRLLCLIGVGLMLAGLFGSPVLPAASAAEVEPFAYQNDRSAQYPWDPQDYRWRPRDPWGYRPPRAGLGYGLPDHYTIHKGKKCELRCERIPGSRDYHCREYRC
jgi:hypothetical protein